MSIYRERLVILLLYTISSIPGNCPSIKLYRNVVDTEIEFLGKKLEISGVKVKRLLGGKDYQQGQFWVCKSEFAINFLWTRLLGWFPMATRFSYYIPRRLYGENSYFVSINILSIFCILYENQKNIYSSITNETRYIFVCYW